MTTTGASVQIPSPDVLRAVADYLMRQGMDQMQGGPMHLASLREAAVHLRKEADAVPARPDDRVEVVTALAELLDDSHYAPDFAPSSILNGRGKPIVTFRNLGANAPQAAALLATLIGATDV